MKDMELLAAIGKTVMRGLLAVAPWWMRVFYPRPMARAVACGKRRGTVISLDIDAIYFCVVISRDGVVRWMETERRPTPGRSDTEWLDVPEKEGQP